MQNWTSVPGRAPTPWIALREMKKQGKGRAAPEPGYQRGLSRGGALVFKKSSQLICPISLRRRGAVPLGCTVFVSTSPISSRSSSKFRRSERLQEFLSKYNCFLVATPEFRNAVILQSFSQNCIIIEDNETHFYLAAIFMLIIYCSHNS